MKKLAIVGLVLLSSCHEEPAPTPTCFETACKPTWASDCQCYGNARMEVLPSGVVMCRCPTGGDAASADGG